MNNKISEIMVLIFLFTLNFACRNFAIRVTNIENKIARTNGDRNTAILKDT